MLIQFGGSAAAILNPTTFGIFDEGEAFDLFQRYFTGSERTAGSGIDYTLTDGRRLSLTDVSSYSSSTVNGVTSVSKQIESILGYFQGGASSFTISSAAYSTSRFLSTTRTNFIEDLLSGSDTLVGTSFNDQLFAFGGDDTLTGAAGADLLDGGEGNDILSGGAGNDIIQGGAGVDTVNFEDATSSGVSVDLSNGTATGSSSGSDSIVGVENIRGSNLSDVLRGDAFANVIDGLQGNDILFGGGGNDTIIGGAGADIAEFSSEFAAHSISFANGTLTITSATSGVDTLTGVEELRFSDRSVAVIAGGGLSLIGSSSSDVITGTNGADVLIGGGAADNLTGGAGADIFRYQSASESGPTTSDTITDFLVGEDRIDLTGTLPTSISVARIAGGGSVVFAETRTGAFQAFVQNANLNGTDFIYTGSFGVFVIGSTEADVIQGTNAPDPILGNGGDDVITGGGGADAIEGGAGRDTFRYTALGDSNQTNGFDNLYDFTTGQDRIDLSLLNARSISILRSDNGSSFIYAETAQGVFLTTAAQRTVQATDITYGNGFGIYMVGSGVADTLVGTSLADPIAGGGGNDTITGGGGADAMFGDAGADTFVYVAASDSTAAATDGIFGFVSGTDRLDLRQVRTGAADTFGIAYLEGGSFLFVDLGGNGSTDMVIGLAATTLVASDILWATGAIGEEPAVKDTGPQTLPGVDEADLFGEDLMSNLSSLDGRFMLDLNPDAARGFYHGQDWYL